MSNDHSSTPPAPATGQTPADLKPVVVGSGAMVRPLSPAARSALRGIGTEWQKVPHWIKASHIAVLIRQGHIEHRWPFDLAARMRVCVPWLREGEIRLKPNIAGQTPRAKPEGCL